MKKFLLTSICLMTMCAFCAHAADVNDSELNKPEYITIEALNGARPSVAGMSVSDENWMEFVIKGLYYSYWDADRNMFKLALLDLFGACANFFLGLEENKISESVVAEYCAKLAHDTWVKQAEQNKNQTTAAADSRHKFVKTYTYKLNGDYGLNGIRTRAVADLRSDYSKEMSEKYCPNASWSYDSRVPQVLCDGKDILKDATGVKRQELSLLLNGVAFVTDITNTKTSDGKIEAKVTVELR